jgi:hypothetical protein
MYSEPTILSVFNATVGRLMGVELSLPSPEQVGEVLQLGQHLQAL